MNKLRNAGSSTNGISRSFQIWLGQHARAFVSSLGQLYKNPLGNLFSTAVIGVSLALPAGFYLMLDNAQRVIENWEGNIQIALYLKQDVSDERASVIMADLANLSAIQNVTLITKDQALIEYKTLSGFAEALDALDENPLPSMLLVQPNMETMSTESGEGLLEELGALAEVDTAQFDHQWVKRLVVILGLMERTVIILTTLLSIAVLLIVGNTIRLSIINKRSEIEINKLFGATDAFIQRPFLYTGLMFGISGSLLAWALILTSILILKEPVNELAFLYNSNFTLRGLDTREVLILLAVGGGLGFLGSWIAVGRHLKEVEPI